MSLDYDELEKVLEKKIDKISKEFNKRINALIKEFAVGGGLEVNRDITLLNKKILQELKDSGIENLYVYMSTILEQINIQNVSYYSNISSIESDIRKSDSVRFVAENLKKNLIGLGLETGLAEKISNTIKPYVLSNSDYKTTSDILSKVIPKEISRYTNQITRGAFSIYDGAIQNTIKQKYNPKKGKYLNSLVEHSRPFCIHMRDTYGNRDITIDELQKSLDEYCPKGIPSDKIIEIDGRKLRKGAGMIEGTTVQNFDIYKGGATNNCNHTWNWIIDEDDIKTEKKETEKKPNVTIRGGSKLSDNERTDIINHTKNQINKLGIKEDIEVNIVDFDGKLAGHVVLKESPEKITKITVSNDSKKPINSMINHELTHVEQINNNRLFLKNGKIVYDGKEVMAISTYKKKFSGKWNEKTLKEYYKLPWETPAFKSE